MKFDFKIPQMAFNKAEDLNFDHRKVLGLGTGVSSIFNDDVKFKIDNLNRDIDNLTTSDETLELMLDSIRRDITENSINLALKNIIEDNKEKSVINVVKVLSASIKSVEKFMKETKLNVWDSIVELERHRNDMIFNFFLLSEGGYVTMNHENTADEVESIQNLLLKDLDILGGLLAYTPLYFYFEDMSLFKYPKALELLIEAEKISLSSAVENNLPDYYYMHKGKLKKHK